MYIYTGHADGKAREIGGYRKEKQPTYKRWGAYKKKGREENWTQIVHKEQNYGKSNPYTENEVLIKKGG